MSSIILKDACEDTLELLVFDKPDCDGEVASFAVTEACYGTSVANVNPKQARKIRKALKPVAEKREKNPAPYDGAVSFFELAPVVGSMAKESATLHAFESCVGYPGPSVVISVSGKGVYVNREQVARLYEQFGSWLAYVTRT